MIPSLAIYLSSYIYAHVTKNIEKFDRYTKYLCRLYMSATIVIGVSIGFYYLVYAYYIWPLFHQPPELASVSEQNFSFKNYSHAFGRRPLQESLQKLFPVGTPKTHIDSVLLKTAGSAPYPLKDSQGEKYEYKRHRQDWPFDDKHQLFKTSHQAASANDCDFGPRGLYPIWSVIFEYDKEQKLILLDVAETDECADIAS